MAASTLYAVLQAVQTTVAAFGFQVGKNGAAGGSYTIPVNIRKLPREEEQLDTTPLFCVGPSQKRKSSTPFDSENNQDVTYPIDIVFIAASNFDYVGTKTMDVFFSWEELVQKKFQDQLLPAVSTVIGCRVEPWVAVDPGKLKKMLDYGGLTATFRSVESRS